MAVVDVAEEHNVAALHEAIAAAVPDRECIVWRDRSLTWADVTERTRRLAAVLAAAGLGTHRPLATCEPWDSPHDHVALYLHNGNEYLEGMLGAAKARCAAVNVNYRYVAEELQYVLADSKAPAIVYHGAFAATLASALPALPRLRLMLQVDDGSGAPLLPGARWYEEALAEATPAPPVGLDPDDLYVVYTGGTTGMPKGVLWRQADFLAACLGVRRSTAQLVEAAPASTLRALPAPPLMHGAAHWNAISAWVAGGTVVLQDDTTHLRADDVLGSAARHRATSLLIVGDAFARPLVDELRRERYELGALRHVLTGGAVLSPSVKRDLLELLPHLSIVDVLGSSESGRQGVRTSRHRGDGDPGAAGFDRSPTAVVLSEDRRRVLAPGEPEIGWLAQTGRVPRGYLGDEAKTRRTFPTIDGRRCAVAGDRARLLVDGSIELHGRDSVTINTGGEKVFAEEVEQVLKQHPAVYDALVVGRPSERWGQEVAAVVALRAGTDATDADLHDTVARHLAGYKVPKLFVRVASVERSASGKPDYRWAQQVVAAPADG
jgi:3-oxocholest-4-en-26-oate---CoA ligase